VYVNAEFASTAHGAETETINLEKICYLQSKGIPEELARNIVISGFRDQVIGLISRDEIREEIREMYVD
jgi:Fe-S cluster assembly protein SufD